MFLSRLGRRIARGDEGMALAAVMGLLAVMVTISVAVLAATISASSISTSTRADVQSQSAADAGVDAVYASIKAGSYVCSASSTTAPAYTATVAYTSSAGSALTCSTTVSGTPATAVITSVGTAAASGLRATDGNSATVRARVAFTTTTTTGTATGSGPAIYSYASGGFSGSGSVRAYQGSVPDVMVKTGDVSCSGAAVSQTTNFVVAGGKLDVSGSCNIAGNVFVRDGLTVTGGVTISGDASASSVSATSGAKISGDVATSGSLTVNGSSKVGSTTSDTVSAASASLDSGTVAGSMWITGATVMNQSTVGKNLTTKTLSRTGGSIGGTTSVVSSGPGASPYSTKTAPTVPSWLDYSYTPSTWSGYTVITLSGTCGYDKLNDALTTLGTQNGILDARSCTGGVNPGDYQTLTLKSNVAIIAKSFTLGGSASFAASSTQTLYLITPDETAGNTPTCPAGSSFSVGGQFGFSSNIRTLIYSPCSVSIASSTSIYGQIWAGSASWSGAGTMYFSPVTLSGYDLAVGGAVTSTTTTTAALSSRYDVSN